MAPDAPVKAGTRDVGYAALPTLMPSKDKSVTARQRALSLERKLPMKSSETVRVITIENVSIQIQRKHIVGRCYSLMHPGALTKKLLEQHDCIGKACPRLEKNANSTYWYARENAQQHKAKIKKKVQARKAAQEEQEAHVREIAEKLQGYIDDIGYDFEVVRVEKLRKNVYKFFYVSENAFADGNRFPEFLTSVNNLHPDWHLALRHIQAEDGRFVTRDEFHEIKKAIRA